MMDTRRAHDTNHLGLFGFALGLFGVLLALAIKVVIIGGLIYLVIRIFSPDTARRLREKWSGSSY